MDAADSSKLVSSQELSSISPCSTTATNSGSGSLCTSGVLSLRLPSLASSHMESSRSMVLLLEDGSISSLSSQYSIFYIPANGSKLGISANKS